MAEPRKWRIVRAVLKVALITSAIVLPVVCYLLGYCFHNWDRAVTLAEVKSGINDEPEYQRLDWLYYPLNLYIASDLPGSETLHTLNFWSQCGAEASWEEVSRNTQEHRARPRRNKR